MLIKSMVDFLKLGTFTGSDKTLVSFLTWWASKCVFKTSMETVHIQLGFCELVKKVNVLLYQYKNNKILKFQLFYLKSATWWVMLPNKLRLLLHHHIVLKGTHPERRDDFSGLDGDELFQLAEDDQEPVVVQHPEVSESQPGIEK